MKLNKLLLLPALLLLTSCKESHIYVTSVITNKWDRQWYQTISTGKITTHVPKHDYYFQFNEWKPYTKKVSEGDYKKFDIGDNFTFTIDEKEKGYFFNESIFVIEEEE